MTEKIDLRTLSFPEISTSFKEKGEPSFRAKQLYSWLWKKSAKDFEMMSDLSKNTREWLSGHFQILPVTIHEKQESSDGTIKLAFKLHDGHLCEGVLIPSGERMTACVSSQVGCSLSCSFCATGYMGRKRDLTAAEIYDQVVIIRLLAEEVYQRPLTNIVYMGMGEPLLNYRQVLTSTQHITGNYGLDMSPKRITVSTAGIGKMIKKLADDEVKFNLALSLHAADDEKRSQIMPINESNNLEVLREALDYFYKKTGTKVTLEYVMLDTFNSSLEDARKLLGFSRKIPCKINLIEYNPVPMSGFGSCPEKRTEEFASWLQEHGATVNIRRSRGKDIKAACGQLANNSGTILQ